MKRRLLTTFICLSMAVLTVGCTGTKDQETDQQNTGTKSDEGSVLKDGEMTELLIVYPGSNSAPASLGAVEEALNEIIGGTMDATVKFQIQDWGSYGDQTNLMLSSGEKMDLFFSMTGSKDYMNKGQLYPLTGLIDEYAPDVKAAFGEYLDACYVDGEIYGLPSFRDFAVQSGLICRKDILDELGVQAEDVTSWNDVEDLLKKVQESHPEMAPLVTVEPQNGMFKYMLGSDFDEIQSGVGCYMDDDSNQIEIVSMYDTEHYAEMAEMAYEWNEKGYFIADATTLTDTRQDILKAGKGFGYIGRIHPGTITQESLNIGMDMATMPISERVVTTQGVNSIQWTVPTNCETPEKALAFLNILYTNPDAQNLFRYGIEGIDYELKDTEKEIAGYPDGVDFSNVGWSNESWITGNAFVGYAWETDPEDVWNKFKEYNNTAVKSPLYGFVFDSANVKNEITAVYNVTQKYKTVVESGYASPKETLKKFNDELKNAGIQNIVDEVSKQVSEWQKIRGKAVL